MTDSPVLTKFQIYRWYNIEDLCLPVQGNMLIAALNATGKSAVLDALKFAYTTSTKFNRAANSNDERDVNSYLRRYKDGESTIDGRIASNIALEFTKPNGNKFVMGVVIDSLRDGDVRPTWYFKDGSISDLIFEENNMVLDRASFKNKNNIEDAVDGYKNAATRIQGKLGIKDMEMFVEKIDQMSAFNPPKNIKEFYKAILKEGDPISVDALTQSAQHIQKLQNSLDQITKSANYLEDVKNKGDVFLKAENKHKKHEVLVKLAKLKNDESKVERNTKEVANLERDTISLLTKIEERKKELEASKEELKRLDMGDDTTSMLLKKKESIFDENERLGENVLKLEQTVSQLDTFLKKVKNTKEQGLLTDVSIPELSNEFINLPYRTTDTAKVITEIVAIENLLNHINETLVRELSLIEKKYKEIEEERSRLLNEKQHLSSGSAVIPSDTKGLKLAIENEFKKQGIKSDVKILCDLVVSIKNEEWISVIESYLGGKRFALVVEPRYLKIAQEIQRKNKFHAARLITTNLLPDIDTANINSLFSLLEISNCDANKYLAYELNNVFMCDSVDDFKNYKTAVTQDGFLYKSFSTQTMKFVNDTCLGKESKKKQLERVNESIETNGVLLEDAKSNKRELELLKAFLKGIELSTSEQFLASYNTIKDNELRLAEIEKEITRVQSNPDFIAQFNRIEHLKGVIRDGEAEIERFKKKVSENEINAQNLKKEIRGIQEGFSLRQVDFEDMVAKFGFSANEITQDYNGRNETARKSLLKEDHLIYYFKEKESAASELRASMAAYTRFADSAMSCEVENLTSFIKEYNEIKNEKYEKTKRMLDEEINDTTTYIREELFDKLQTKFKDARRTINNINSNLKNSFEAIDSGEYYRIDLKVTKDAEMKYIYDLIHSSEEYFYGEDSETKEKISSLIKDLIEKNEEMDDFRHRICDYRNYFDCDIVVCDAVTGEESSLIKRGNTTSGKETQAPYYIIASICIKLASRDGAPALLFIDEAFDKCDDINIKKLMNFLRHQQMQLIMATPPGKITALQQYIDELIPLAKDNDGLVVHTDVKYYKDGVYVESI